MIKKKKIASLKCLRIGKAWHNHFLIFFNGLMISLSVFISQFDVSFSLWLIRHFCFWTIFSVFSLTNSFSIIETFMLIDHNHVLFSSCFNLIIIFLYFSYILLPFFVCKSWESLESTSRLKLILLYRLWS